MSGYAKIGKNKAAELLSQATGFRVERWHVTEMVANGLLVKAGELNGWDTYATHQVMAVARERRPEIQAIVQPETRRRTAAFWAADIVHKGNAVILDTETTDLDGVPIQVAIVDVPTGRTLLNTLAHPGRHRIHPDAQAKHHISHDMLTDAPLWASVLADVIAHTRDRMILAYNAEFDREVILRASEAISADPQHLADPLSWTCLMTMRRHWLGATGNRRLGGDHSAVGDCMAARDLLFSIASDPTPTTGST